MAHYQIYTDEALALEREVFTVYMTYYNEHPQYHDYMMAPFDLEYEQNYQMFVAIMVDSLRPSLCMIEDSSLYLTGKYQSEAALLFYLRNHLDQQLLVDNQYVVTCKDLFGQLQDVPPTECVCALTESLGEIWTDSIIPSEAAYAAGDGVNAFHIVFSSNVAFDITEGLSTAYLNALAPAVFVERLRDAVGLHLVLYYRRTIFVMGDSFVPLVFMQVDDMDGLFSLLSNRSAWIVETYDDSGYHRVENAFVVRQFLHFAQGAYQGDILKRHQLYADEYDSIERISTISRIGDENFHLRYERVVYYPYVPLE